MDTDLKLSHRKSRAPWQSSGPSAKANNPYGRNVSGALNPYATHDNKSRHTDYEDNNRNVYNTNSNSNNNSNNINNNNSNSNSIGNQTIGNQIAANNTNNKNYTSKSNASKVSGYSDSDYQPVNANAAARKHTRRLSIHASAVAHAHGKSFSQAAPPALDLLNLPPLPKISTSDSRMADKPEEDEFNVEKKISTDLANGSAADIDDYYKLLQKQKALVIRDIKQNINQNQKNILQLTDDLKDTQDELLQLRVLTRDLYEVLDYFKDTAQRRLDLELEPQLNQNQAIQSTSTISLKLPPKKRDRSSILVLEKIWANELQSLFKHVEGASKYVQALPGRHVLAESGRWQEVNVGTWKPNNLAHLFVLNDLLLIAGKKALQDGGGSKSRLQAVQCWPLNQVLLTEIHAPNTLHKQDDTKVYLINIKSKTLSYVYQTDRYDHFLKITEAYNKGRNELLQKDRLKNAGRTSGIDFGDSKEEKRQLRESLRNSGVYSESLDDLSGKRLSGSKRNSAEVLLQDISARVHSRNRSHDFGTTYANMKNKSHFFNEVKSLESRLDDIDVELAHNQYAAAVGLIAHIEGKLRGIENALIMNESPDNDISDELLLIDVTRLKLSNRKESVQKSLIFDLQYDIAKLTDEKIENIVTWFESLDQLDKGVESYLAAMSNHLSETVSRLIVGVQGSTKIDVVNYLSTLVVIHISIIKRAVLVYNKKISPILKKHKDGNVDSSSLINWCVEEITKLVAEVKKHLYGTLLTTKGVDPETDKQVYKVKDRKLYHDLQQVIIPQLAELKNVGVNVDFIFEDILSAQDRE